MNYQNVDVKFSLSGQITEKDIDTLCKAGVGLIVCNRPDVEVEREFSFDAIEKKASECGIESVYIPFKPTGLTEYEISKFSEIFRKGLRVHGYCRTGNRSFNLYAAYLAREGKSKLLISQLANKLGFAMPAHDYLIYEGEHNEL